MMDIRILVRKYFHFYAFFIIPTCQFQNDFISFRFDIALSFIAVPPIPELHEGHAVLPRFGPRKAHERSSVGAKDRA